MNTTGSAPSSPSCNTITYVIRNPYITKNMITFIMAEHALLQSESLPDKSTSNPYLYRVDFSPCLAKPSNLSFAKAPKIGSSTSSESTFFLVNLPCPCFISECHWPKYSYSLFVNFPLPCLTLFSHSPSYTEPSLQVQIPTPFLIPFSVVGPMY